MRHLKLIVLGALAVLVLAAPASASARHRDRNHDRIPDRWEKTHKLSLRVDQARRDQDHDGLKNKAEYRAHMDPRDADSDNDGVEDGQEHAGKVVSFDGTTLVVDVFGSTPLTAKVTADTEIECDPGDDNGEGEVETHAWRNEGGDEGDGQSGDEGDHNDQGDDDQGEDNNDQGDDEESDDESCPDGALAPGAIVQEAELSLTSAGLVFEKIELVG
jgi:hypothetical protein